jgi:hypothetical protein
MKTLLSQRWAFAVAFVLPTLLLAVSPADAAVVLSNINQTWGNGYGFTPPAQIGLGFNTGSSAGQIDGLSLSLLKGNNINATSSITFSVVLYPADTNGWPSGSPLAQDNGLTAAWTNPVAGQFQQQTFTYGGSSLPNLFAATLQANTKYVLALANDSGTPSFEHYWGLATSGGYTVSQGYSFTTTTRAPDGTTWAAFPAVFPIAEMSVTAVPEPSTYCMALAGLACGGYSMWRRKHTS